MFPQAAMRLTIILQRSAPADHAFLPAGRNETALAVEEVSPEKWTQDVYTPEILEKADQLIKKPGYDPLA